MNVPSRDELEKSKVHLEFINVDGEWKRINTFYDIAKAIKYGENLFSSTGTVHRLVDNKNRIIELFD
tara:strand:+ start:64 stop:264 length:201 start_codon:yes stop_codon:yes gene_type:complete